MDELVNINDYVLDGHVLESIGLPPDIDLNQIEIWKGKHVDGYDTFLINNYSGRGPAFVSTPNLMRKDDSKNLERNYLPVMDFFNSYFSGDRFKELLTKHNDNLKESAEHGTNGVSYYKLFSFNPVSNIKFGATSRGTRALPDNTVLFDAGRDYTNDYDHIGMDTNMSYAHELGHIYSKNFNPLTITDGYSIDGNNILFGTPVDRESYKYIDYVNSYPIFRNSSAFKTLLKKTKDPDLFSEDAEEKIKDTYYKLDQDALSKYGITPKIAHDASLGEMYSDLMALRYDLYRNGMYLSMAKGEDITLDQVLQYQKLNPEFRLFKYYSPEDIVIMLNTVAQLNNSHQNNYNMQYAKFGRKLIKRKSY